MISKCSECGSIRDVVQHHVSYVPEEIIPLCRSCHRKLHGRYKIEKKRNETEFVISEKGIRMCGKGTNYRIGNVRAMKLPAGLKIADEFSYASNRILIADLRGEIDCDSLLSFFEEYVEPEFWDWYEEWKKRRKEIKEDAVRSPR